MTNYEIARAYALSTVSPEVLTSPALFKDWLDIMLAKFNEPRPKQDAPQVVIYTDGACSGNPGPGGYGAVLMLGDRHREISGGEPNSTNNRMELMAAIAALSALKRRCNVTLFSDSAYLVDAFNRRWIESWQRNGWKNSQKKAVENQDLWEQLIPLAKTHTVTFVKVKGHADNEWNNRCDQLAVAAAAQQGGVA
jgi:ribonuclease HI